jgi:TPR repeat protein
MMKLCGQKGTAVNLTEAIRYLQQSAIKADIDAPQGAYVYALLLAGEFPNINVPETLLPRDERSALHMLEKSASLGFSHAESKLGSTYENGTLGCGYDPILSLHYYTLAAKQGILPCFFLGVMVGDVEAMMGLSKWYLCGADEIPRSEEKAFINAERAAKMGHPAAEFAMGTLNETTTC